MFGAEVRAAGACAMAAKVSVAMNECVRFGLVSIALLTFGCGTSNGVGSAVRGAGASGNAGGSLNLGGTSSTGGDGIIVPNGGTDSGGGGAPAGTSCDGKLTGYIRDFLAARSPDFEPFDMKYPNRMPGKMDKNVIEAGIVQASLGADKKPVYALGDGTTSLTTTGSANFATWFHDLDGLNMGETLNLQFTKDPTDPTGSTFKYDSAPNGFFPIDNQLLSPTLPAEGQIHNFSFTFELHTLFKYVKGQKFNFRGDDDVWAFINNQLVVDIGGIHDAFAKNVDLDTLGLTEGSEYPLDFFFAERHIGASDFLCETTIEFTTCDIVVK
jgi:fibro-slime domain-containing protein